VSKFEQVCFETSYSEATDGIGFHKDADSVIEAVKATDGNRMAPLARHPQLARV
jgi:hypothetical protein